jgi:hypothetical protein
VPGEIPSAIQKHDKDDRNQKRYGARASDGRRKDGAGRGNIAPNWVVSEGMCWAQVVDVSWEYIMGDL